MINNNNEGEILNKQPNFGEWVEITMQYDY